ncbi:MAG: pyridoxal phosphate-dependent aminotransferase [Candidatus Lambdaproteobacteria bacterium]|nr:pyridoxal phosphate-dependent aminotransferase [Candidatus Lambdaproteobacteria bacterium]
MTHASSRIASIKPFQAVEVFQAARELEAEGRSIVHLEFGEPDFPTPAPIKEAAIQAMLADHTRYTHSMGLLAFREAIAGYHHQKYGVAVDPEQVLVSMGTSILAQMAMLLLLEPGDQVILSDPTYACYANFVRLAGGEPVHVPLSEGAGFQLDPAAVRAALTPRTRALFICSPANPTGVALRPEVLAELALLGLPIISDEIYHGLTYEGAERTLLEFTDRALVLNGFSKYFAMTGWRLGYMIFPKALREPLMRLHQTVMISAADYVQYAGMAAIARAIPECETYRAEYDRRREYVIERLASIGLPLGYRPQGAFYALVNVRRFSGDSLALAMEILREAGVALTPGIDFGAGGEGYLRLSYANSIENIAEGLTRLDAFFKARG